MLVISTSDDVPSAALQIWIGEPLDVVFAGVDPFFDEYSAVHDILGEEAIPLEGRNLATAPYRYFLSGTSERFLSVGIVAASPRPDGAVQLYFGNLEGVKAEEGIVREYRVELVPVDVIDDQIPQCLHLHDGSDIFLTRGTDYDCDGFGEPEDCFPKNGNFHPGALDFCDSGGKRIDGNCNGLCDEDSEDAQNPGTATCGTVIIPDDGEELCAVADCEEPPDGVRLGEICDGFDTDCDPKTLRYDASAPCFGRAEGLGCRFGTMQCNDFDGSGAEPFSCFAEGDTRPPLPDPFCDAFDSCVDEDLPLECAFEQLQIKTVRCRVHVDIEGSQVCTQPLRVFLDNAGGADNCVVELLDARFDPFVGAQFDRGSIDECFDGTLTFSAEANASEPSSFDLLLTKSAMSGARDMLRIGVDVVSVDSCNLPTPVPVCDQPVAF